MRHGAGFDGGSGGSAAQNAESSAQNAQQLTNLWRDAKKGFALKVDTSQAAKPLVEINSPSTSRHLACGDPNQAKPVTSNIYTLSNDHYKNSTFTTSTIDIQITIEVHHEGHFEFFLCDVGETGTVTQECFDKRALVRAADGYASPPSPVDAAYPGRYYIGAFCRGQMDKYSYTVRYKLPALQCARCVLQWHYITGNACLVPGARAFNAAWQGCAPNKQASRFPNLPDCGGQQVTEEFCGQQVTEEFWQQVTEEFWNCADVTISNNGMCGYGARGNGTCATKGQCCDKNGYCRKCARRAAATLLSGEQSDFEVEIEPEVEVEAEQEQGAAQSNLRAVV
ncbi:hypothetical protein JKP88DRAFT_283971 [Tribonema minus]|uniref:Chitin-binding type-4 domain-containing protein n=1 Tax=Tribonema minus TaxID=303371 RepID=A0A836C7V8_9STRA|nr:hypothetical protein JKP88DRAFT_283971 [Tribonema minus]